MKNQVKFALLSIMVLLGAVGFTACSSSDESTAAVDNPNYNPDTDEVNLQFVFNVSTGNTPITRMSSANTQASLSDAFRGIDNANILPYKLGTRNDGGHVAAASEAARLFDLSTILNSGSLDPDGNGTTVPQSHRIVELSLPSETNAMLFYGKAIKTGTDEQQGKIDFTVDKDVSNNSFKLVQRVYSDNKAFTDSEVLIVTILNRIIRNGFGGTESWNNNTINVTYPDNAQPTDDNTFKNQKLDWSDYANAAGESPVTHGDMTALEEILGDAYDRFVTIRSGSVRAGSGEAIARQIGDVWQVINKVKDATPTSLAEAVARAVAGRLSTRFANYFKEAGVNCKWLPLSNVKNNLANHLSENEKKALGDFSAVTGDLNEFPTNFNLPKGAAQLSIDKAERTVTYNSDKVSFGTIGEVNYAEATSVYNYMYPAELCYFGNSPLRTSATSHVPSEYPDGVGNWTNDTKWTADWSNDSHVLSDTRSVAMRDNINYGTAMLQSTVKYSTLTLKDNNSGINSPEEDKKIEVKAGTFELTGILIGGQNNEMGWDYVRKYTSGTAATAAGEGHSEKFNYVIFDKDIPSTAIPASTTEASEPNYTLVFDNYDNGKGDDEQNAVYVALEFKNGSGQDFYGQHNLIRSGGTFYIVGKLDPTAAGLSVTFPTDYALPPYNADGTTIEAKRVFIQDYMTTANFTIGDESLKHAYVTVPDLRSTQISLGLNVDVSWSAGLVFDNVELGK